MYNSEIDEIRNNPEHFRVLYVNSKRHGLSAEEIAENYGLRVKRVEEDLDLLRKADASEGNIEKILKLKF